MQHHRWIELRLDSNAELTEKEIREGWHFCPSFKHQLIGPTMLEYKDCLCEKHNQCQDRIDMENIS